MYTKLDYQLKAYEFNPIIKKGNKAGQKFLLVTMMQKLRL